MKKSPSSARQKNLETAIRILTREFGRSGGTSFGVIITADKVELEAGVDGGVDGDARQFDSDDVPAMTEWIDRLPTVDWKRSPPDSDDDLDD